MFHCRMDGQKYMNEIKLKRMCRCRVVLSLFFVKLRMKIKKKLREKGSYLPVFSVCCY